MRDRDADALVLRSVAYGESDRIVTLFCRDLGCVGAMARGARKSQRRFGGGLDFGTRGRATLKELPGRDLAILERFEVIERPRHFGDDIARTAHAAYAAELVTRFVAPHHGENQLFDWVTTFLAILDEQGATANRLRVFELGLLRTLGLAPTLDRCAVCGRIWDEGSDVFAASPVRLRWAPELGGAACESCVNRGRPLSAETRHVLRRLEGESLDAVDSVLAPEANRACRKAIAELLAQNLTTPLKTVEFIHKMETSETRAAAIYPPPLSQ
jgi:DNA repair protein RecO (recombination protein O)